jgi:hypothetical protein
MRTWPRRLVLPTPEFPMITTLTVRMWTVMIERCQVPLGASQWWRSPTERRASRVANPQPIPMNATGQTTNPAAEPPLIPNQLPPSENKLFRKWRREFSLITGYAIDPAERVFTINRRNCERWKKDLLNYSTSCLSLIPYSHALTDDVM